LSVTTAVGDASVADVEPRSRIGACELLNARTPHAERDDDNEGGAYREDS
jgi:hypothetical protein